MSGSWAAAMQASLMATFARPAWWCIALAAFLVRGGVIVALLPIVVAPSTASLTNAFAPSIEALILGRPSIEGVVLGTLLISMVLAALLVALLTGSWLDIALLRASSVDDELGVPWSPVRGSVVSVVVSALVVRLAAHLPTLLALGYAAVRIIGALYAELTSPGDPAQPLVVRVLGQAPDAPLVVAVAWLLGEAVGALAARRVAAGEPARIAFQRSIRQVLMPRGLATLGLTSVVLAGLIVPFALAASGSWGQVRTALLEGSGPVGTSAALVLMVSTWVLGLTVLGGALAWRAIAWTVLIGPRATAVTQPMVQASEPSRGS